MKKFIALAIAIIMMAAIAVPAFAENTVDETSDNKAPTAEVTYGVSEGYVVTVPSAVAFTTTGGADAKSNTVSASEVVIPGNKKLQVTMASDTTAGKVAYTMVATNGSDAVPYKVSKDEITVAEGVLTGYDAAVALGNNAVVLLVDSNQEDGEGSVTLAKSQSLYFATQGTTQSGSYSDTLTFTVSLVDA